VPRVDSEALSRFCSPVTVIVRGFFLAIHDRCAINWQHETPTEETHRGCRGWRLPWGRFARLSMRAASCASLVARAASGSFGFLNRPTALFLARTSWSGPSPLAASCVPNQIVPVMPTRAIEADAVALLDWIASGQEHDRNRGGRCLSSQDRIAASGRSITATLRPTRSDASAGNCSYRFSAKR
jgi:hypothetical protein